MYQITKIDLVKQRIPKECAIPKYLYLSILALGLGFGTFLVRIVFSIDVFPFGLPIPFIIQYIMMFSFGVIIVRYDWIKQTTKSHVKVWVIIITASFILFFAYAIPVLGFEGDYSILMGGFNIHALLFALVENIICVGMIFVLLKVFYAKFNKQGKIMKNLSSSAFYIYLIHPPVLLPVSLAFAAIPLIPVVKLGVVFPLTVIFCYLLSHFGLEKIHLKKPKRVNLNS